jgi:hypothetical protein
MLHRLYGFGVPSIKKKPVFFLKSCEIFFFPNPLIFPHKKKLRRLISAEHAGSWFLFAASQWPSPRVGRGRFRIPAGLFRGQTVSARKPGRARQTVNALPAPKIRVARSPGVEARRFWLRSPALRKRQKNKANDQARQRQQVGRV